MIILKAHVDWHEGWANFPSIALAVDSLPKMDDLRYEERAGIYYAERDGYVSFFYWTEPGEGYGGRTFVLKMVDGSERSLQGPWSSNPGHVNSVGFGPCLAATIASGKHLYVEHYCTLSLVRDILPHVSVGSGYTIGKEDRIVFPPGSRCALTKIDFFGKPLYVPAVKMPDGSLWRKDCKNGLLEVIE
jgi:hypothetical protein